MLKKLLKYDLKSIFKLWWIAAASTVLLSCLSGIFLGPLEGTATLPFFAEVLGSLFEMLLIMSLMGFMLFSQVLVFIRYFKNFFSDEGYLTFTLPVKRSELLNSKLISGVLTIIAADLVYVVDIFIIVAAVNPDIIKSIFEAIIESIKDLGVYFFVFAFEILIICLLLAIFSTLFMFACITIGSVIAKRAKVMVAIGFYYGASSFFGTAMFMFLVSLSGVDGWFNSLGNAAENMVIALIMLLIIAFLAFVSICIYNLLYTLLDKKLNLT